MKGKLSMWEMIKLIPKIVYWRWFWKPPQYPDGEGIDPLQK